MAVWLYIVRRFYCYIKTIETDTKDGFYQRVPWKKGENHRETAIREVREETGVTGKIIDYIDKSEYSFNTPSGIVNKEVYWYLMTADSYYSKPQREEFFYDSGYYKYIEAYHLLKFPNEKNILEKAYLMSKSLIK